MRNEEVHLWTILFVIGISVAFFLVTSNYDYDMPKQIERKDLKVDAWDHTIIFGKPSNEIISFYQFAYHWEDRSGFGDVYVTTLTETKVYEDRYWFVRSGGIIYIW